jgi:hypothetical protein
MQIQAFFSIQFYSAEISLLEVAVHNYMAPVNPNDHLHRLDLLYACLQSTKSLFDAYASLPWTVYFTVTFEFFARWRHAIVVLSKLTLFDYEGWDTEHVRKQIDLIRLLDQVSEQFNEAKKVFQANPLTMEHDTFSRFAKMLQDMKASYIANLESDFSHGASLLQPRMATTQVENGVPGSQFEYSVGEVFWGDIMNDWEFLQ